ncbi:hypothetical protein [Microvirga puerhi]|uniref:Uncharacterized protein n=1 Tax=Microvirga puerhi TaxID=2876078 RepID=A0ABS7VKE1_9HYPH|nr:hypothetical protein [Microvirga puerhi]MBZ6075413.1 hypothetical protein [Microvirga puerhi]
MFEVLLFPLIAVALLPSLGDAHAAEVTDKRRGTMTFTSRDVSEICKDCSVVQASGTFGTGTIAAYHEFAQRNFFKKNIYFVLDSPGGSMNAALHLGTILRELNANTIVGQAVVRRGEVEIEPARCTSACVFAFAGGTTRSTSSGSRLGVHSWMPADAVDTESSEGKVHKPRLMDQKAVGELQRQTAVYLKYLQAMGIDLRIAVPMLQTPYERMAWLSRRDQSLWSLITVDSRLSTPADRTWPILFLPQTASARNKALTKSP